MRVASKRKNQEGVSLILGTAAMVMIVPMLGMFVDTGVLYVTKTRLQSAVDGASLAAARALNLGQSPSLQQSSAQQNGVNWFYANFPNGTWGTTSTSMDLNSVTFSNAGNIRSVQVTASTNAPTYFMKWFNVNSTTISATGTASRRDVVIMMVMDRSSSMNSNNGCTNMRSAAKLFTGQFAAGRDQLGMVEFSDSAFVDTPPTTNFQTVLGYTNNSGSAAGLIDSISCNGNTNTPQGLSLGYNELYRANLPGAFNILMFFTDGIPNSATVNFSDPNLMMSTSNCQSSNGRSIASGNAAWASNPPHWTSGWTFPAGSFLSNVPAGPIGVVRSDDPSSHGTYALNYYMGSSQTSTGQGTVGTGTAPGCAFASTQTNYTSDFQKLPPQDIYGNALTGYNNVSLDANGNVQLTSVADDGTPLSGNNLIFHYIARNASDNAAQTARSNATLPVTIFGVGLGGTSQAPPGYDFMQRITNDPNPDLYNSPALYPACSSEPTCQHWTNQPQGTFIFSSSPTQLNRVFLTMASQILRLSQ